jgi:RecA/RadA recombinase
VCAKSSHLQVGVVIVDSIASLFRSEFEMSEGVQRAMLLFEMAAILKRISSQHSVLVITTNQATSVISDLEVRTNPFSPNQIQIQLNAKYICFYVVMQPNAIRPSLGLTWSNCVTTRMRVSRSVRKIDTVTVLPPGNPLFANTSPNSSVCVRKLEVFLSPSIPLQRQIEFVVTTAGVFEAGQVALVKEV